MLVIEREERGRTTLCIHGYGIAVWGARSRAFWASWRPFCWGWVAEFGRGVVWRPLCRRKPGSPVRAERDLPVVRVSGYQFGSWSIRPMSGVDPESSI